MRKDKKENELLVILNLTPVVREGHITGVSGPGEWEIVFNTDTPAFGGNGVENEEFFIAEEGEYQNMPCFLRVNLPGMGGLALAKRSRK